MLGAETGSAIAAAAATGAATVGSGTDGKSRPAVERSTASIAAVTESSTGVAASGAPPELSVKTEGFEIVETAAATRDT